MSDELEKLVKTIAKSLDSFGFQHAIRNCRIPKYGDDAYVEENWDSKTLAIFISDDIEAYISKYYIPKTEVEKDTDG